MLDRKQIKISRDLQAKKVQIIICDIYQTALFEVNMTDDNVNEGF